MRRKAEKPDGARELALAHGRAAACRVAGGCAAARHVAARRAGTRQAAGCCRTGTRQAARRMAAHQAIGCCAAALLVMTLALSGCAGGANSSLTDALDAAGASSTGMSAPDAGSEAGAGAGTNAAGSASSATTATLETVNTATLDGEPFTQDRFSSYDLTMVNIWTTSCTYCVDEMPALQLLSDSLPANVGIVGICADASRNADLARAITQSSGITYPNLVDNDQLDHDLLTYVPGVPTTVFVDNQGKLVGKSQIGAPAKGSDEVVASAYRTLIDEHLEELL